MYFVTDCDFFSKSNSRLIIKGSSQRAFQLVQFLIFFRHSNLRMASFLVSARVPIGKMSGRIIASSNQISCARVAETALVSIRT